MMFKWWNTLEHLSCEVPWGHDFREPVNAEVDSNILFDNTVITRDRLTLPPEWSCIAQRKL